MYRLHRQSDFNGLVLFCFVYTAYLPYLNKQYHQKCHPQDSINPGSTRKLKKLTRQKKRSFEKARKTKRKSDFDRYHRLKAATQKECRKAYRDYINDIINSELSANPKRFWGFIKTLVGVVLSTCPSGDLSFGGKCYYFGRDIENERRGHEICKARRGQLASINSKAEDDAIIQHIESMNLPYSIGTRLFGGAQDEISGTFVWEDGTSLTYSNWGPQQPDNYVSAEDCVTLYRPFGLLSHFNCDVAVEVLHL
ncbi:unnamed protein product [Mytilus edulis]|uniref:C-type lectin domain-containing protein n=1 Tax=Mytilus edulis TaxID=6550 RepID=A0A8S3QJL4_MYTED|nr:unnamed protein product [Mytilus edulis]